MSVTSPAMDGEVQKVQLHLARDWHSAPEKTFPSILMLGGLWGSETENSWSYRTDIVSYFGDKNVTLVLPVGGSGSFYSDWEQPDNGQNYKWETFLTKELPLVLRHWRIQDEHRAVMGVSMGATSAVNLAARNPDMFDAVGSFSGYLDTTSLGLPQLFAANLKSSGFDATKMWGPYHSRNWREHDPKLLVRNLKGKVVYVSAGTGTAGNHDKPNDKPGFLNNPREFGSRVTSQNFVNAAKLAGVDVTVRFRPNGTHTWAYWEPEVKNMWPMIAEKWGLDEGDLSVNCTVTGAFKERQDDETARDIGECITDAYKDEHGNQVQEFGGATVYLNSTTNVAYAQWGATGKKYEEMGGPESWLGYPTFEEKKLSKGDYARYEGGRIHYISEYGAVAVKSDVLSAWAGRDYERGMGYPTADEADVLGADGGVIGQSQTFEQGTFYRNKADGKVFSLKGDVLKKYDELGGPAGTLGFPDRNDRDGLDDGGSYSRFENGAIYSTSRTGAHVMYKGPVYDAWKKEGYEHPWGIGYPVEDDVADPKAQRVVSFERGTVHVPADGSPTVTRTPVEEPAPDPDEGQDPAEGQAPEAPAVPASEEQIPAPAQ
ncbi:alpha/beta hydrolase-fold protein [Corynebacterium variabile]|uniref:alpha/beta hydrolase-fold protein n=1 Tax=Corynebacterium variabile TaxID=1727 RepID=UPI00093FA7F1|nr:alpha/beta hydrolase-fold protein [Corynebacterium variabile]